MKYIILSFDDGRKDTYDIAYKLLKKYNFTASIHITTGFIDGTMKNKHGNVFENIPAMSIKNAIEMSNCGFDISSHGDMHINEENDLKNSLIKLREWGLINSENNIVFSSPYSEIYEGNSIQYSDMLYKNGIKYLRSGNQVRRNGILYCLLYVLHILFKSKILFYMLNRKNIMSIKKIGFGVQNDEFIIIPAIAVKYWHTIKQLKYFLQKLQDNDLSVFLFHGIMYEKDIVQKNDWVFSAEKFEFFLGMLQMDKNIKILNIKEYIEQKFDYIN